VQRNNLIIIFHLFRKGVGQTGEQNIYFQTETLPLVVIPPTISLMHICIKCIIPNSEQYTFHFSEKTGRKA
jgi:hypothetical protein